MERDYDRAGPFYITEEDMSATGMLKEDTIALFFTADMATVFRIWT